MRQYEKVFIFLFVALFAAGHCREQYAVPKRDNTGVYENHKRVLNERPLFKAGEDSRLVIVERRGDKLKVKNEEGAEGWVEKSWVSITSTSTVMSFGSAEVMGYLDNPALIYVLVGDSLRGTPIRLDRSFSEHLKDNVDRPTVERRAD